MVEVMEPQTPEEAAALRALAAKHRRRHRWVALLPSVAVSFFTTAILYTTWHDWPLDARDLAWLAFVVMHAPAGLSPWVWCLRGLRAEEALDRRWILQDVRWKAQTRAWRQEGEERRQQRREGRGGQMTPPTRGS